MCSVQLDSQAGLVYFLILFRKWHCGLEGEGVCGENGGGGVVFSVGRRLPTDGANDYELLKVVSVETRPPQNRLAESLCTLCVGRHMIA